MKLDKPILVALAHPDDETWLSGTLSFLSRENSNIYVLYATSGGAGKDRSGLGRHKEYLAFAREQETIKALKQLGVHQAPIYLKLDDKNLELFAKDFKIKLSAIIEEYQIENIISFDPYGITQHKDHIFIGQQAKQVWQSEKFKYKAIDFYQVVISDTRASSANNLAKKREHPFRIKHATNSNKINTRVNVADQQINRVLAFASYRTQFPPSLMALWQEFTEFDQYEEFIKLSNNLRKLNR
ncbi:PIG-L deacetylase family protein [Catenovulum maritimum]|uniref:GlcNAc-PI de-N-acetylase n=1 Tax=Catenovulum maritimum TaxID=1513271 RepID=A0A0J8GXI1_9ALTE|nr:PIG-L family deacetylase [Catenovulum maritimum]KMT65959.1 hypothetical protein XM47_05745 [Catenovulum maritimum]